MKFKSELEIAEFLTPYAEQIGVKLWDVELKKGKTPELNLFIDKDGGVDLDTCEKFHRLIDEPLDSFDPTYALPYTLNVSSKGVDWPFKKDEHFLSHIGQMVEVKLASSISGKKFYEGVLLSYDGKSVSIKVDGKFTFTTPLKNVVKMNEYIEFN